MFGFSIRDQRFPVKFTIVQRVVVAEIVPGLARPMKNSESNRQIVNLTVDEFRTIRAEATASLPHTKTGEKQNSLRRVIAITSDAIGRFEGIEEIPAPERVYQIKITLKGIDPPIWRRIVVREWTLDKLHQHIQRAMGWTNSHGHRFKINRRYYGDPCVMAGNFKRFSYEDSTKTQLSQIVPHTGKRFSFEYEYGPWRHEILFERRFRAEQGKRYPMCLEGQRACPPEKVGGIRGYKEFLKVSADPNHERHDEFLACGAFDAVVATKGMRDGQPIRREMV